MCFSLGSSLFTHRLLSAKKKQDKITRVIVSF